MVDGRIVRVCKQNIAPWISNAHTLNYVHNNKDTHTHQVFNITQSLQQHTLIFCIGWIQEFAYRGMVPPLLSPSLPVPIPSPFHYPFSLPLEVGPLNQLESLEEHSKLPQRRPGQNPSQKRIWCTGGIMAIIVNILSTMFYSRTIKI